mmetsp:Transcript_44912/g.88859  ORF Transcript_44912/g.88859 Transcript_44912/m.88859 type:complete len:83 (+) Transcript_44912:1285-1533(+)
MAVHTAAAAALGGTTARSARPQLDDGEGRATVLERRSRCSGRRNPHPLQFEVKARLLGLPKQTAKLWVIPDARTLTSPKIFT